MFYLSFQNLVVIVSIETVCGPATVYFYPICIVNFRRIFLFFLTICDLQKNSKWDRLIIIKWILNRIQFNNSSNNIKVVPISNYY